MQDQVILPPPPPEPTKLPLHLLPNIVERHTRITLMVITGLAGSTLVLATLLVWTLFFDKNQTVQQIPNKIFTEQPSPIPTPNNLATISGIVTFEGYAPDEANIAIAKRLQNETIFKDVVTGLSPKNASNTWEWKDAEIGKNYVLKALLKRDGETLQESLQVVISAPAKDVALKIVSQQKPSEQKNATISGTLHVDGYIPNGSAITIQAKKSDESTYQDIITNLQATNGRSWSWGKAISGQTYTLKATLYSQDATQISNEENKTIVAPATGIEFDISSTAAPPTQSISGLSGTITINGSIPSKSRISLAVKKKGETSYTEVNNNISATNGVSWSFDNAQTGTEYDVQSYMWVNDKPYAQSNTLTLTAPSTGNTFTINAQQTLAAPGSDTISVTCNGAQNGLYQALIKYNTKANLVSPQSYNAVITLVSNSSQAMFTTITPSNPNIAQSLTTAYILTKSATYQAQYAYNTSSISTFSSFSSPIQFFCE